MPMSEDQIFEKVQEALVDALGVDDDEVIPDAKISEDLGAESIDYLDITFRLEKAFDIKIPRGELIPDNLLNNPEYVQNGKLTDEGLKEFEQRMPHADLSEFKQDPAVDKIMDLFTVQTIVNYIKNKLNG
jgi:acyl carrier protein